MNKIRRNRLVQKFTLLGLFAMAGSLALAAPIDLTTWQKRGPAANGTWNVASGGGSVTQTTNGNPTFFVSPGNFLNSTLSGTIRVVSSDDDFVGFVFGFQGPAATGNDMNFLLLDWKRGNQTFGGRLAQEGFALSRVNGTITDYNPGFWGHTDSDEFDVLATDYGADRGWRPSILYTFEVLYQENRIEVVVSGGAFGTGETIFDLAGTFEAGRFGFYNYSQAGVTYAGITEEDTPLPPPPPPGGEIPEPTTVGLVGVTLLGVAVVRRRRR